MIIYKHTDYIEYLKDAVAERKQLDPGFSFQKLAAAIGVQKPYLSKVLHGNAHLNQDQMFLVGQTFSLAGEELEYAFLLLEIARTGLAPRKREIARQIEKVRSRKLDSSAWVNSTPVDSAQPGLSDYYLDPYHQLVHVLLSVERFKRNPASLAPAIGLGGERLQLILQNLERMGLVRIDKGTASTVVRNIHLPKDSTLYASWRTTVRLLSLQRLQAVRTEAAYAFSMFFSADRATYDSIRADYLEFLKRSDKKIKKAPADEVYQMTFDLFPWTD